MTGARESWTARAFLLALVVLGTVIGGGFATLAVAASDVELANETVSLTNDTDTVYAEISNTSYNTTVTMTAIDSDGTELEMLNQTVQPVSENNTTLVEDSPDTSTYDKYRVVVSGNETDNGTASITIGTFEKTTGGAGGTDDGGLFSDWSNGQLFLGFILIAAVFAVMKED